MKESKARESEEAALEFYRKEKEKHCEEADDKLMQSEINFCALQKYYD